MAPPKEKKEHKYIPPSWIDEKFIKTLPKEKQTYWANRIQGVPGQGKPKSLTKSFKTPDNIAMGFDNDGRMVAKTRAMRRQKPPTENQYTKSTHSMKKARSK